MDRDRSRARGAAAATGSGGDGESQRLWRISGLGFELVSMILGGALLGWCLDLLFNTKPTILIIGTIFGVLSGMTQFIRKASKLSQTSAANAPRLPRRDLSHLDEENDNDAGDDWPETN